MTVGKIARNATQRFGQGSGLLGDTVALHGPNGLDIVAITKRSQTFSPHVFTNVGIDPLQKQILVVKSMQHFYAGFAPIAAKILYVASPGALVPDVTLLDYRKARRDHLADGVENTYFAAFHLKGSVKCHPIAC